MRGARIDPRSALRRTRLRLPIRWKLALVSASLTFVILLLFAIFVGVFTEQRLRSSFDDDLRATAADLQEGFRLQPNLGTDPDLTVPRETLRTAGAGGAVIRILDRSGRVLARTERAPDLGPAVEGVRDAGDYRVVSRPLFAPSLQRSNQLGLIEPLQGVVAYVQYGKPKRNVETTLGRVRLFLAGGVLGGTALALIAGLAVARRAMRPIAGLTRAAREIGRTRDPARRLPRPVANDEVADLAHTLEEMLRELDAARGETEAALSRQREFVADASHELRTPLTSILANLELLHAELSGEDAEIAGSALRSSRRMRRLVADLLLLARADAGRRAPRKPVDVGAVVRDAVAEAAPIAAGRELALDVPDTHGSATPAFVEGSPDDLHRLALNLIENALIHTPAGTTVRASVRREPPRAVDGAFGPAVVLEVADDGPGIPAAVRHRIFDRFARGAGDAGPVRGGSGLGLAIVRAVTEAHGGTVTLDERERGGARFVVRLPAIAAPKPMAPTRARLARRRVVG